MLEYEVFSFGALPPLAPLWQALETCGLNPENLRNLQFLTIPHIKSHSPLCPYAPFITAFLLESASLLPKITIASF